MFLSTGRFLYTLFMVSHLVCKGTTVNLLPIKFLSGKDGVEDTRLDLESTYNLELEVNKYWDSNRG